EKQRKEQVGIRGTYRKQPADERCRQKLILNTSWSFALKAHTVLVGCDGIAHVTVQKYRNECCT
uniref:hypothetical protein n=1 Tax=Lactonifactor longoviformis TaxID=341220 RepID=UPI000D41070C